MSQHRDRVAWLVESVPMTPVIDPLVLYVAAVSETKPLWTAAPNKAMQFASQQAAEAYIGEHAIERARAAEHMWVATQE